VAYRRAPKKLYRAFHLPRVEPGVDTTLREYCFPGVLPKGLAVIAALRGSGQKKDGRLIPSKGVYVAHCPPRDTMGEFRLPHPAFGGQRVSSFEICAHPYRSCFQEGEEYLGRPHLPILSI